MSNNKYSTCRSYPHSNNIELSNFEDVDLEGQTNSIHDSSSLNQQLSNLSTTTTSTTNNSANKSHFEGLQLSGVDRLILSTLGGLQNISNITIPKSTKKTHQELMIDAKTKYDNEISKKVDISKLVKAKEYALESQKHTFLSKNWFKSIFKAYTLFYDAYQLSNGLTSLHLSFLKSGAIWGLNTLLRTPTFGINNQYATIGLQFFNLAITPAYIGSSIDILVGSAGNPFFLLGMPTLDASITKEDSYKKIGYKLSELEKNTDKIDKNDLESNPQQSIIQNKIEFDSLVKKKSRQDAHTNYYQFGSGGVVRSIMGTLAIVSLSIIIAQFEQLNGWQNGVVALTYLAIMIMSSAIDRNLQHIMMILFNLRYSTLIPNNEELEQINNSDNPDEKLEKLQKDLKLCLQEPEQIKLKQVKDNTTYQISKLVHDKDLSEPNSDKHKEISSKLDAISHDFELLQKGDWDKLDDKSFVSKDILSTWHRFRNNIKTHLNTNGTLHAQIIKNYTNSFYSIVFAPAIMSVIGDILRYNLNDRQLALKLYIMFKNISRGVLLIANTLSSVERITTKDIVRNPDDLDNARVVEITDAESGDITKHHIDRNDKIITKSIQIGDDKIDVLTNDNQYNRLHPTKFTPYARIAQSVNAGIFPRTVISKFSTGSKIEHLSPKLITSYAN
jgi:hypothetical protein